MSHNLLMATSVSSQRTSEKNNHKEDLGSVKLGASASGRPHPRRENAWPRDPSRPSTFSAQNTSFRYWRMRYVRGRYPCAAFIPPQPRFDPPRLSPRLTPRPAPTGSSLASRRLDPISLNPGKGLDPARRWRYFMKTRRQQPNVISHTI
jgi:hypothetical protein